MKVTGKTSNLGMAFAKKSRKIEIFVILSNSWNKYQRIKLIWSGGSLVGEHGSSQL